jgi:hypothetical protein
MKRTTRKNLAIFFANYRKSNKFSDPIAFAESARNLIQEYGSAERVARDLEKGKETIRALAKVAGMPTEVKKRISSGELLLTVAFDLLPFESSRQIELSRAVAGLSFKDARAVLRYAKSHPNESATAARKMVLAELEKHEMVLAVMRFPMDTYKIITRVDPNKTIIGAAQRWLDEGAPALSPLASGRGRLRIIVRVPRELHARLKRNGRNVPNLLERIVDYYFAEPRTSARKTIVKSHVR